jgi:hypothetical protein
LPAAVTRWLPDTCSAGAGPPPPLPPVGLPLGDGLGELDGEDEGDEEADADAEALGVVLGVGEPTVPLHRVPLRVKLVGTVLVPE